MPKCPTCGAHKAEPQGREQALAEVQKRFGSDAGKPLQERVDARLQRLGVRPSSPNSVG